MLKLLQENLTLIVILWVGSLSLVSFFVTVYDKWAAKHNPRHRSRENTLLLLSLLGGSVAMFVTMLMIRHKTKHLKFMLGIPAIMILQAAAIITYFVL
jgi:uncharacterized membrane protein YsdA (DUF1294 family)